MGQKRTRSETPQYGNYFTDPGLKYPTVERAREIDSDLPFERLKYLLNKNVKSKSKSQNMVHWFRTKDVRIEDNIALAAALDLVKQSSASNLITLMIFQPFELEFHGVGDARKAFMVDNIRVLKEKLENLNIPLVFLLSRSKKETTTKLVEFIKANSVSHVFANFEYEHDELLRDIDAANALYDASAGFQLFHDQTIIEPGTVTNSNGEPRKVFTPFWHAWVSMVGKDANRFYRNLKPVPQKQKENKAKITDGDVAIDELDEVLEINRKAIGDILKLWPVGYEGAQNTLDDFIAHKIRSYGDLRSIPAENCVSRMSPYFALGLISVREVLRKVQDDANNGEVFGTTMKGSDAWVREIVFREHYRQMVACVMPHIVMNMPSSLKLADVETNENSEAWERWCEGKTGVPFVDAGMRQLNAEGYMHNRCRMNVASYLKMTLMIDFRLGLRYFANKLVDWDCCNNSFGWDPSYTVFNPVLQGEKCDPRGDYIRKWVPELQNVQGKALFDPANRLEPSQFAKLDYPRPLIDLATAKKESVERMKRASASRVKKEEDE